MFFLKTIVVPSKYFAFAFVKRQNIFVVRQNSIIWRELAPPEVAMVEFCVLIYIPHPDVASQFTAECAKDTLESQQYDMRIQASLPEGGGTSFCCLIFKIKFKTGRYNNRRGLPNNTRPRVTEGVRFPVLCFR